MLNVTHRRKHCAIGFDPSAPLGDAVGVDMAQFGSSEHLSDVADVVAEVVVDGVLPPPALPPQS